MDTAKKIIINNCRIRENFYISLQKTKVLLEFVDKQIKYAHKHGEKIMGLAASQARFLQLTARKSDLEFRGQQLNQERTINAHNMESLVEQMQAAAQVNDNGQLVNPNVYDVIVAELELKHSIDRTLELELKNVDTQQQEVQTEVDAVSKVIDKNIDMTFKTFA